MRKIGYEVVYYQCYDSESFALTLESGPTIIYIAPTQTLGALFSCMNMTNYFWYETSGRVELDENDSHVDKYTNTLRGQVSTFTKVCESYDDFRCVVLPKEELEHKFNKELTTSPLNCFFKPVFAKCSEILETARLDVASI